MTGAPRLLLDTHVLLWALIDPARLDESSRRLIEDGATEVYVSPVSTWEIEIKRALGKLDTPDDLERQLREARFAKLPLRIDHTQALCDLPPLHRDPFDRMLIAQARVEGLTLVTKDAALEGYGVTLLRA